MSTTKCQNHPTSTSRCSCGVSSHRSPSLTTRISKRSRGKRSALVAHSAEHRCVEIMVVVAAEVARSTTRTADRITTPIVDQIPLRLTLTRASYHLRRLKVRKQIIEVLRCLNRYRDGARRLHRTGTTTMGTRLHLRSRATTTMHRRVGILMVHHPIQPGMAIPLEIRAIDLPQTNTMLVHRRIGVMVGMKGIGSKRRECGLHACNHKILVRSRESCSICAMKKSQKFALERAIDICSKSNWMKVSNLPLVLNSMYPVKTKIEIDCAIDCFRKYGRAVTLLDLEFTVLYSKFQSFATTNQKVTISSLTEWVRLKVSQPLLHRYPGFPRETIYVSPTM